MQQLKTIEKLFILVVTNEYNISYQLIYTCNNHFICFLSMMGIYVIQCIIYTVVKYINNSNNGGVYISMKVFTTKV